LLVYLVVDQFPMDLYHRTLPHFEHGLARLTGAEAWVGTAQYTHAVTYTCPGHATLSTGASPLVHGIIGNGWMQDGEPRYCGDIDNLLADTLADRVKAAGGDVAVFSLKDRAALMMGGRSPDAIAWYLKDEATWSEGAPDWLDNTGILSVLDRPWEARRPELYAEHFPDAQPHEDEMAPVGNTFPHPAPTAEHPRLFRVLPASGGVLTDVAIQSVDAHDLGADDVADLLVVSYSQTDYVGHAYTPQSWEAMDAILALDEDIGRLLDALDERLGRDGYAVVLTADHGAANSTAEWIDTDQMMEAVQAASDGAGLQGEVRYGDPFLFLPAHEDPTVREAAARAVAAVAAEFTGVVGAYPWRFEGLPEGLEVRDAVAQSLHPERAGDVYVLLGEDVLLSYQGSTQGTGHGTPWLHDAAVPLLFLGPGVVADKELRVDARAVAPTAAALLQLPAPQDAEIESIRGAVVARPGPEVAP